jgi:hypothetical protein
MTGYLARMAARAVTGEGTAAPRLPSRFELPTGAPEQVDGTGVTLPAVGPGRIPLERAERSGPPQIDSGSTARSNGARQASPRPDDGSRRAEQVATGRRPGPVARPAVGDVSRADERPRRVIGQTPELQPAQLADLDAVGSATRIVVDSHVSLPHAAGVVRAMPTGGIDKPPTSGVAAAEQVVTITIGRVDVRASVAAPPTAPAPVRDKEAGAEPLSLHDYLHGRRESR